jgi:Adenylate and Guanylate cyclase catalytic domain
MLLMPLQSEGRYSKSSKLIHGTNCECLLTTRLRLPPFIHRTIGDCYVAASGIPEAREDHAFAMARFAQDILRKCSFIVKQLEVSLGPDTGCVIILCSPLDLRPNVFSCCPKGIFRFELEYTQGQLQRVFCAATRVDFNSYVSLLHCDSQGLPNSQFFGW